MASSPVRLRILECRVDAVSESSALAFIESLLLDRRPHHIITGNTLMLLEAQSDAILKNILEQAALVVPESSGILWASRVLAQPLTAFVPGIDLMMRLVSYAHRAHKSIYLLGSAPGIAEETARILRSDHPGLQIVGCRDGFFKDGETGILSDIKDQHPDFVFVGLGMPRQEKWIAANLQAFGPAILMGVGGSFDVISGRLQRAPAVFRRLGIEWLYRLVQEPWRWRRIVQLPVFACKVLQERFASGMSIPSKP